MKIKSTTYREPTGSGTRVTQRMRHFSHNEFLPAGRWSEYAMSDCPMGCKVYRNETTGSLAVMHNSNYNCQR